MGEPGESCAEEAKADVTRRQEALAKQIAAASQRHARGMEERLAARKQAREEKEAMRAAERAAEEERKKNEGPFSATRRQIRARMMAVTLVQQQYLAAAAKAEAGTSLHSFHSYAFLRRLLQAPLIHQCVPGTL